MSTIGKWIRANPKRLPKRGRIIAGGWRGNEWSMSSVTGKGWESFIDDDRTHYLRLPPPPKKIKP